VCHSLIHIARWVYATLVIIQCSHSTTTFNITNVQMSLYKYTIIISNVIYYCRSTVCIVIDRIITVFLLWKQQAKGGSTEYVHHLFYDDIITINLRFGSKSSYMYNACPSATKEDQLRSLTLEKGKCFLGMWIANYFVAIGFANWVATCLPYNASPHFLQYPVTLCHLLKFAIYSNRAVTSIL